MGTCPVAQIGSGFRVVWTNAEFESYDEFAYRCGLEIFYSYPRHSHLFRPWITFDGVVQLQFSEPLLLRYDHLREWIVVEEECMQARQLRLRRRCLQRRCRCAQEQQLMLRTRSLRMESGQGDV